MEKLVSAEAKQSVDNRVPEWGDIESKYSLLGRPVNRGEYWYVQMGKCKQTNLVRRIMVFLKEEEATCPQYTATLKVMTMVDHPTIANVYEIIENDEKVFVVSESCDAGDLFDRIMETERLSEKEANGIFRKLIECIEYLHSRRIILRDIRPESFQFVSSFDLSQLRLVDFSAALLTGSDVISSAEQGHKNREHDEEMKEGKQNVHPANIECLSLNQPIEGPPFYRSPESVKGIFTEKGDLWSLGALLYLMLLGRPPFSGGSDEEILEQVSSGKFDKNEDFTNLISSEAQNLICSLLSDENNRLSISQVMEHPWMATAVPNKSLADIKAKPPSEKTIIKNMNDELLQIISEADTDEELGRLLEECRAGDPELSNCLKAVEFYRLLEKAFPRRADKLLKIFSKQIGDKKALMNYREYIVLAGDHRIFRIDQQIQESFRYFDVNGDEIVSLDDISSGLKKDSKFESIGVKVLDGLMILGLEGAKKELNLVEFKSFLSLK
jgi:calcium-dependent protein kinase